MPMFIRKPTPPVELNQFIHGKPLPHGVSLDEDGRSYVITAHNQKVYLKSGDWVAMEPDGIHYYPITDAIKRERFDEFVTDKIA